MDYISAINETLLPIEEAAIKFTRFSRDENFVWLFGRGRYPNTLLAFDGNSYSIILFKSNKAFHRGTIENTEPVVMVAKKAQAINMLKKSYFSLTPQKFFSQLVTKHNVDTSAIHQVFPELSKLTMEDSLTNVEKVGKFEISYNDPKEAKHLGALFAEACKLLGKAGYDKICYGKVLATPELRAKSVLANYHTEDDYIRVANKGRKSPDAVRTLIHELGHRLYYKFMNSSQHKKIKDMYDEMMSSKFEVEIGDRFEDNKGIEIEIHDSSYSRGKVYYSFKRGDSGYKATAEALSTYKFLGNSRENKRGASKNVHPYQVSFYARSKPEEFFAEVFAHAVYHDRKDLRQWIKSL